MPVPKTPKPHSSYNFLFKIKEVIKSLQFVDLILEDDLGTLVDQRINDSRHGEDSSNDCADVNQELEDILLGVWVMDCDGWNLEVEEDDVFLVVVVDFVSGSQLEGFCRENVSNSMVSFKLWRNGVEEEANSHVFL